LRLFDPKTGNYLDTYSEAVQGRRQAERQARQATQQLELLQQQARQATQQLERERHELEQERREKELLAQQLRSLGINPDEFLKNLKNT
jgi:chromosome segregation ATPase